MKKLYIAEKYLYMKIYNIQRQRTKKKAFVNYRATKNRLSSFCTTLTTHMTKADEEDKLLDRIKMLIKRHQCLF